MVTTTSDWLTHFRPLSRCLSSNQSGPRIWFAYISSASTQSPLSSYAFSNWSVDKDDHPGVCFSSIFSTFLYKPLHVFQRHLIWSTYYTGWISYLISCVMALPSFEERKERKNSKRTFKSPYIQSIGYMYCHVLILCVCHAHVRVLNTVYHLSVVVVYSARLQNKGLLIRSPLETIFILNFSLSSHPSQLGKSNTNEINHDIHPRVIGR